MKEFAAGSLGAVTAHRIEWILSGRSAVEQMRQWQQVLQAEHIMDADPKRFSLLSVFQITETKEGGMMVITTTQVTQIHQIVKTLQDGPESAKEILWSQGPWQGEELEKACGNCYEVQGYLPFATRGNDQCKSKAFCVLTFAALPNTSPFPPLHAPFTSSTLGSQVPGVDSLCSPLQHVRGGVSPSKGNASKTRASLPQATVEQNRRELVTFCQQCWQFTNFRHNADYQDRVCPYCLASGTRILGDELYIICQCPTTKVVLGRFTVKFQRLTRLLDLSSLTSFSIEETTRLVQVNPPPQILHKDLRRWIQEATPLCCEFAYALRTHVTSLQPVVVDMSSDDDNAASSDNHDDFSLILPPPGFRPVFIPPTTTMLAFLDPASQQLIGHHTLFKWPTYGCCLGRISERNSNPRSQMCKQVVNFIVFYPDDGSSGPQCLSLDNYNIDGDNDSPNHTWLLLEPSNLQHSSSFKSSTLREAKVPWLLASDRYTFPAGL